MGDIEKKRKKYEMKTFDFIKYIVKKVFYFLEALVAIFLGIFSVLLACSSSWMFHTWPKLNMDELMYQLNAPMKGTNLDMIKEFIQYVIPPVLLVLIALIVIMICVRRTGGYHKTVIGILVLAFGITFGTVYYTGNRLDLKNYTANQGTYSNFIDTNYVDPSDVQITFPEKKRNMIYIYLESVEATYSDKAHGGAFDVDYIPELTTLAQQNEDFSGADPKLNGGYTMPSTTWTVAAMFGQSAGIPLSIPVSGNSMDQQETFLPGVTAIGDILENAGYNQTLLIGSDATFGGRRQLFTDHGNYDIKDYYYANENDWIGKDYRVWWGYEDARLFLFAKNELQELAAKEEPFNLTLLTVDTHFEDGYYCYLCEDVHDGDNYANVLSCASKQVAEFVAWVQQQPFYENTTIVISGDHLTMDSDFCLEVDQNPEYTRKVYTTYINSAVPVEKPEMRREFTTFDNFPTALASLGVTIEGNRLGLGTNLFSGEYTLTELYGTGRMESELKKKSKLMEKFTADIVTEEEQVQLEQPSAVLTVGEYDYTVGYLPLYITEIDDKEKGIGGINVAVWVNEDQSDIQWMQAQPQEDGSFLMNIDVPNFNYKTGNYKIDAYLVDNNGDQHLLGNAVGYVQ